jgi:hypothetical protein
MADRNAGDLIPASPIHDVTDAAAAAQNAVTALRDEITGTPGKFSIVGFQKEESQITDAPDKIIKAITISSTRSQVDAKTFVDPQTPAQFASRGFENEHVTRTDTQFSNYAITSTMTTDSTGPQKHTHEDASFIFSPDGRKSERFVSTEDQGTQHADTTGYIFIQSNGTELYSASGQTNITDYGQRNPDGTGFFTRTNRTTYNGEPVVYVSAETCTITNDDRTCSTSETATVDGKQPISKVSPSTAANFDLHFPSIDAPPPVLPIVGQETVGATRKHRKGTG